MIGTNFFPLLRFELSYQFRTKAVYIFALLYFGFSFLMGTQGATPAGVNYNSEYELFFKMGLLSLGAVFSIMFFVITAIQRDSKFGMEAVIFSTPLSNSTFFFTRFLGAWLVAILVIVVAIPGFYLGIYLADLDQSRIQAFQWTDSLSVAWMLLIPSITICTVLLYSVCLLTKSSLATYSMAVLIYVLYFISAIFLNSPLLANAAPVSSENLFIAALADPFGLSAFFEQSNLWTPYQKNELAISFLSLLGLNRLIWIGISGLLLSFSYAKFSFRTEHSRNKKRIKELVSEQTQLGHKPYKFPKKPTISVKNYNAITLSLVKQNLNFILKSIPFWAVMGTWLVLAITEIFSKINAGGAYDESYFPASQLLLEQVQQPLYIFGVLLLIFFSGELVWRAKTVKFHEIIGATPTPNSYFFLSKLLSLFTMIGLLIGATIIITICFQTVQSYLNKDSLALFSLFIYPGLSLVFYSAIFLLIQNYSKNNYLGMGISAITFALFAGPLGTALGFNHPLFKIGDLPPLSYSQQAGWEMNAAGFWILALLWTLLIITWILFSITNSTSSLSRISRKFGWNRPHKAGLFSLIGFSVLAGFCFYQINYVENYQSRAEILYAKQSYELKYKQFEKSENLKYSSLKMKIDLFPSKGTYKALVEGKLKNNSKISISKMMLTEKEELLKLNLEKATQITKDEQLGVYLVEFNSPILPDEEIEFSFEVQTKAALFTSNPAVIKDGSYLNFRDFAPNFGYFEGREISDNQERKKRNLPLKANGFSTLDDHEIEENNLTKVDFEAELSTESTQIALTSGDLINQKIEGNRAVFSYKSVNKILPAIAFFSGNYHTESVESNGVKLEVYSLPAHRFASEVTLATMKSSLKVLSSTFGKYPDQHLKIIEVPSYWGFGGFAHPGVISMVEDNYFLVKPELINQFDLQRKRVIHEVAHQWFGHILAPRNIPGASLFVEGFAKYAEAIVLSPDLGKSAFWHLTKNANQTYFAGRASASEAEPSIANMTNQNYLAYGKSVLSLLAVEELLGSEKLNSVIREIVAENQHSPHPNVAIHDFLQRIKSGSSPTEATLITDWFEKVVHYEIKLEDETSKQLPNGEFELKIAYSSKKLATSPDGSIQEIPMDEPITIALLSAHPQEMNSDSKIISSHVFPLHTGKGGITIISKVKPQWIGIDPWGTRPDANRRDNFFKMD